LNYRHKELEKTQHRLKQYQAALRLARAEMEQRNRGILALTTFAYQASRITDLTNLLKLALIRALSISNAPAGAIVLIDPETKVLKLSIQKGLTPEFAEILTGQQLGQGALVLMPHLVAGAGALLEYDTAEDDLERLLLDSGNLTSLVSLPLHFDSRLLGALLVGLYDKHHFKAAELSLLMALSQEIAVALESLRLREGLWQTFETLFGSASTSIDLQEGDPAEFSLDVATPLELPSSPASALRPAEDDLEQLLAAMMEAEDEVQRQNLDLKTLNALAEKINHTLDLKEILNCALGQTLTLLSCESAWVYLLNEYDRLELQAYNGLSATYVRGMKLLELGDGIEGQVAAESKAYFIRSVSSDSVHHKIWVDKERLEAVAAVPITRPGQARPERTSSGQGMPTDSHVIGVLAVGSRDQKNWGPREVRLLSSIANQIAPSIENAQLYAQVQEDQAGLKVGNEILRSVNDMLLEKNAFLEGFIQDDLKPALKQVAELLAYLQDENPATLARTYQKDMATLQEIVMRLNRMALETNLMNKALNHEFERALERKDQAGDYISAAKPVRLGKRDRSEPKGENIDGDDLPLTEINGANLKDNRTETERKQQEAAPTKALSFEEAVAAGLVPEYILDREKD
jgi:GAF domain-containing protein